MDRGALWPTIPWITKSHCNGRKCFLMRVKEESKEAGLNLNILKTKIMASSPNCSWQIEEEKVETGKFYFLGLQNHCGQCLKR